MELLILLIIFGVGFWAGELYGMYKIVTSLREVIDIEKALGLEKQEKPASTVYKLEVETHGDMLYLFDSESDSFICQGSSVQELATLAKEYKNVLYAAVKYNDKVFAFKDGKSIEVIA